MLKKDVAVGRVYRVRLSGTFRDIRIDSVSIRGGWNATNLETGRAIRIKSAAKLRFEIGGDTRVAAEKADQADAVKAAILEKIAELRSLQSN